jgi:hypothetical protein
MKGNEMNTSRTDTTNRVVDYFRGHGEEYSMLKGLLLATHAMDGVDARQFDSLIDTMMVAKRMDEINAATLAGVQRRAA